jgi:hypothetical protein
MKTPELVPATYFGGDYFGNKSNIEGAQGAVEIPLRVQEAAGTGGMRAWQVGCQAGDAASARIQKRSM